MSFNLFMGAVDEGLIYAFVAMGLLISYKILGIADMTTDGSFVLGAAVSSMLAVSGHPFLGIVLAILAGSLAGLITSMMQTKFGIPSILAGIITMTGLYSVNLFVQGGSASFSYPMAKTVFSSAATIVGERYSVTVLMIIFVVITIAKLSWFFSTSLGLSVRATGDNIEMVQASSINPTATITIGLCMSNALVALSGALLAQKETRADLSIGVGVVIIGLASLVLGGGIAFKGKVTKGAIGAVVGAVIYRVIYTAALKYTPDPGYLKIVSAGIIAVVIALSNKKGAFGKAFSLNGRKGKDNA